eukprot:TRINITY_DN10454_c0_g1_i1.p1 TRINITY_DN10454_c0_g1~~TRINITY_DN10454_c0_g1_i1.p1  ORF type:complete len:379 (-),score=69.87 TRINITY_DN10454_c0_g1_i1:20-1156(-)
MTEGTPLGLVERADRYYEFGMHNEAFALYRKAEADGPRDGHVLFRLGVMYHNAWGTNKNDSLSAQYFEAALNSLEPLRLTSSIAMCDLGYMYENGFGVSKDKIQAFTYYQNSASLGYPRAQFNCGYMHHYGQGTPLNYKTAVQYYQLAANSGFPLGQYNLGFMHQHGYGIPRSLQETIKYYLLSAEQGYPRAQYMLGFLHKSGSFGSNEEQNKANKLKYYTLAAHNGHGNASEELAKCYEKGDGTNQDFNRAVYYRLRASVCYIDNSTAKKQLLKLFSGAYEDIKINNKESNLTGESYRIIAVMFLAKNWPNSHPLLAVGCKQSILEVFLTMKILGLPNELIAIIATHLVAIWKENHVVHLIQDDIKRMPLSHPLEIL